MKIYIVKLHWSNGAYEDYLYQQDDFILKAFTEYEKAYEFMNGKIQKLFNIGKEKRLKPVIEDNVIYMLTVLDENDEPIYEFEKDVPLDMRGGEYTFTIVETELES